MGAGIDYRTRNRRTAFWIAPVVGALTAIALATVALVVDNAADWVDSPFPVFAGEKDTARTMLSVIAGSVTTLIALVFTILAVIIQLASSQYSPRALNTLLEDRPSHWTIGVFVGTFTYCLVLLLTLRFTTTDLDHEVAGLSLTVAFVLAVVSIGTFAVYSNHIIHSARITSIVTRIAGAAHEVIDTYYQAPYEDHDEESDSTSEPPRESDSSAQGAGDEVCIMAPESGLLVDFDENMLLDVATRMGGVVRILPRIGTYVPKGTPFILLVGGKTVADADRKRLEKKVRLSAERSLDRDLGFGLRQLVDIAARALSTGINDPATAVQVIDQLHDLMRVLVVRRLGTAAKEDEHGVVRVEWNIPSWGELSSLALNELRLHGESSVHVMRRLRALVEDLHGVAPEGRKATLRRQLRLLDKSVERTFHDNVVREQARQADSGGASF